MDCKTFWRNIITNKPLNNNLNQKSRRFLKILSDTVKQFFEIDGANWASAFAFNAFFSLFPLMILLVTIASFFVDRETAGTEVINYIESYIPITGEMQRYIFDVVTSVLQTREQASVIALLILIWSAMQCFSTLICAANRAWGGTETNWWRLPLKSLLLLGTIGGTVLLGIGVSALMRIAQGWIFSENYFHVWLYAVSSYLIPVMLVFFSLSLFYKWAPPNPMRFSQVWLPALFATLLLQATESAFVIYLTNFASFNAVYGTFGGIIAIQMWIYLSGCIFILGACMCDTLTKEDAVLTRADNT